MSVEAMEEEDHCSQFIDMDLDRISTSWDTGSTSWIRNLQKKSFSSEEFDFGKCRMYMKGAMYDEQVLDVAPADEIFFKGQLLPLQQDPRLRLVHSLGYTEQVHTDANADVIDIEIDKKARTSVEYYPNRKSLRNENADEKKISLFATSQGEHFIECFNAKHQEKKFILSCVDEERFILPIEEDEEDDDVGHRMSTKSAGYVEDDFHQNLALVNRQAGIPSVPARSSHSEGVFDGLRNDSRSSSFRSQQSSYWSCGDKDSRDSSSSSRCSNGSSQDSCFQNSDKKPPLPQILSMDTSRPRIKSPIFEVNGEFNYQRKASIAGNNSSKGKKWSWKSIFGGLRKASKMSIEDDKPQGQQKTQGRDLVNKVHKRSVFPFKTPSFGQRKSTSGEGESEGNDISRYYIAGAGINYFDTNVVGKESKDKAKTWSAAKESWQRCVNKVKRGKLFVHHKGHHMDDDIHHGYNSKAKSLSTTPLAKSPARRRENPNINIDCGFSLNGTSTTTSSSKYMNLGFASCPASMRSSPHHSGVLAVVNKPPPLSSVQDIHTAIQGAIAHCKQSQGA